MAGGGWTVRFRGRTIPVPPGRTLLSVLAQGLPILQRSIRYHRPRAPFCGIGYCTNCLVRVNGVPNVRSCTYLPHPGDRVRTENSWPSPKWDLFGALDWIFPNGIDTLHGFRRPAFASPIYQRVVRRLAGYGRWPEGPAVANPEPAPLQAVETIVVGAGETGREAAATAVRAGGTVHLVERRPRGTATDGATTHFGSTALFLPPPDPALPFPFRLLASSASGPAKLFAAKRVIVAVGAYDANLWFAGNDRPGVMTGDGALAFMREGEPAPFRRALLVGGGSRASALLDRIADGVEAICTPGVIEPEVVRKASSLGIDLYPRSLLLSASGRRRVRSVRIARRGGGSPTDLGVDAVVLAHRRMPNLQLFFQAGARMRYDRPHGAYYPVLEPDGQTSIPGLLARGSCAGAAGPAGAAAETSSAGSTNSPHELEGYYRELLARPREGKFVACPCEDVLLHEVEEASRRGFRGIEVIKRYTSLGTGLCQGRFCLPDALLVLSILEQRPPAEVGFITQRPPVVPASLGGLAALPDPAGEAAA